MEARIRRKAGAVGAQVAPAGCDANLTVAFAHDGGDLVRRIVGRRSVPLAGVPPERRRELKTGSAPIRWWYSAAPQSRDGIAAASVAPPWTAGNAQGGGSVLPVGEGVSSLQHYSASLISTGELRAITSATVVIDVQRSAGVPLAAAMDYASMVALA